MPECKSCRPWQGLRDACGVSCPLWRLRAAPLSVPCGASWLHWVPHEVTPAMTIANGKPKILKEGKTNGQQNGESIGVGNQGETLARMEVELWARLSVCFWAYKTHANRRHKWRPPVDPFHRRFHFVSPLQLLHGVVVASIEVFYDCELLCLDGLLYVISGILAGDSWFPHSAVLLPSLDGMALCLLWFCFFLFVLGLAIPISKLIQRYHLTSSVVSELDHRSLLIAFWCLFCSNQMAALCMH